MPFMHRMAAAVVAAALLVRPQLPAAWGATQGGIRRVLLVAAVAMGGRCGITLVGATLMRGWVQAGLAVMVLMGRLMCMAARGWLCRSLKMVRLILRLSSC